MRRRQYYMGLPLKIEDAKFSYKNYLSWPENERWELIDGVAYDMTPAPSVYHQRILRELFLVLGNYLFDKDCEVFSAPFDVRFAKKDARDEDVDNVVQPDIVVICDKSKLDDRGCAGAPDMIIEILSPATASKDMIQKFKLYESYGVLEYWIVQPLDKTVMVFKSGKDKKFGKPEIYSIENTVKVGVLKDLAIELKMIFKD